MEEGKCVGKKKRKQELERKRKIRGRKRSKVVGMKKE